MQEKKFNYFYKITNLVNDMYYYGIHSTNKLKDGYMGSGTKLTNSVKKNGKENFIKENICFFPSRKQASDFERSIVTEEVINDKLSYNLRIGGENGGTHSLETRKKMSKAKAGIKQTEIQKINRKKAFDALKGTKAWQERSEKISKSHTGLKRSKFPDSWYEKHKINSEKSKEYKHTPEAIEKIRVARLGKPMSDQCIENRKKYWKEHPEELKAKTTKMVLTRKENGTNTHTEESKRKISENNRKTSCSINGIIYESIKIASNQLKLSRNLINGRMDSTLEIYKDWIRLTEKESRKSYKNKKLCFISGKIYIGIKEAAEELNISKDKIYKRLKSLELEWKDWNYYNEDIKV